MKTIDYQKFEQNLVFRTDKQKIVKELFPQYESFCEYVHREYLSGKPCSVIAAPFWSLGMTENNPRRLLMRMGVKRRRCGGANYIKLNWEKVKAIRKSSKTARELAKQYKVTVDCIRAVLKNKTWNGV